MAWLTVRRRLLILPLVLVLAIAGGCGDDDSDDGGATTSSGVTAETSALVGVWEADNECQALSDALAEAGLEEFTVDMAKGGGLLPAGEPDPSDPCRRAKPVEHLHAFSESGDFNSLDENGNEVDFGTYEVTGEDTFTLIRPPFESEVRYQVEGDTATFDVVVPECETQNCRFGAALAIATFFPRTYERVK